MSGRLVHRGPDSDGLFVAGRSALAARRLSIIDLDGRPPADRQRGRQRRRRPERRDLQLPRAEARSSRARGHRFATDCDTEVLVHLYEEHGDGFVERLRGMFAIALWDERRRRLLLARDRFGIKPLYYRDAGGELSFASELKAMLEQPGFSREIDPEAVAAYLAFNSIPAPLTIFAEARKLPPGPPADLAGGRGRAVAATRGPARSPAERAAARARRTSSRRSCARCSRDCVRAHLVADVPVGVLLSGGVDSGGLAALAAADAERAAADLLDRLRGERLRRARRGRAWSPSATAPTTTSWSCAPTRSSCCRSWSRPSTSRSATPRRCPPTSSPSSPPATSRWRSRARAATSSSAATTPTSPTCSRRASAASRRSPRRWSRRCPSRDDRVGFDYKAKRFARAAAPAAAGAPPRLEGDLLGAGARRAARRRATPAGTRSTSTASATPRPTAPSRWRGCRTSTSASTWSTTCWSRPTGSAWPTRWSCGSPSSTSGSPSSPSRCRRRCKVRGFAKKRLLRRALAPLLPQEIVHGRKQGFSIPLAAWLRGPLEPFAREVLAPATLERQGCLDPAAVTPLLDRHCSGREDLSRQIWGLMALTLWFDRYARLTPRRPPRLPRCAGVAGAAPGAADEPAGGAGRGDRLPQRALAARRPDAEARRPRDPRRRRSSPA